MKDSRKRSRARHVRVGGPTDASSQTKKQKRGRHASAAYPQKSFGARSSTDRPAPPLPAKAAKWKYPEPQEWVASDDERERRRKKPRVGVPAAVKPSFAITPTPRGRALNRKKLSASAKQRLKREKQEAHARVAPGFSRGSSASVRKLLTLQLHGADLESDLHAFAQFVSLTPDERAFRKRTFDEISALIRGVFPGATVELYGSSSSGMETFRSDLDITVGNLDFSKMRTLADESAQDAVHPVSESDGPEEENEAEEEDENRANQAGYVVSDTDGASSGSDDEDEPTFSLNLSIPGLTNSETVDKPVVAASTSLKSPWNPTLRRQKMRQLRALQQLLMTHRPQFQIKCLSKAKIPILMIVDPASGLNIDLGVNREAFRASDHGRTTALVTQLQLALGAPFIAIVVFLKEFLHQFDLDKPFTGGLGSYRLYMMVAYIFTTRFPAPQRSTANSNNRKRKAPSPADQVSPAKVLLTFLDVFGNRQKRGFFTSSTELPVRHGSLMDVVDFTAVFRLDDCVDKFAMAFDIITKQRGLGGIVFEDALQNERRDCAKRMIQQLEKEEQLRELQRLDRKQHEEPAEPEEEDASSDDEDEKWFYDKHGR